VTTSLLLAMSLLSTTAHAADDEAISRAILAFGDPGTSTWDAAVKAILVEGYDADASGWLDTEAEVQSMSCPVWEALFTAFTKSSYGGNLDAIYGFAPNMLWVGNALGFDETVRAAAYAHQGSCGLTDGWAPSYAFGDDPIRSIAAAPASDAWDQAVSEVLLGSYDADGSGAIDVAAELESIPCEVLEAMNEAVERSEYEAPFWVVYGFDPDLFWVGYTVGIDESLRAAGLAHMDACGLVQRAEAPPPPELGEYDSVPEAILGFPAPGSSEWDDLVEALLLKHYDADGSGQIDDASELDSIPCDVWEAITIAFRDSEYDNTFDVVYGFAPAYIWVGSAIGLSETLREPAFYLLRACGETSAGPPSGGTGSLTPPVKAPAPVSDEWTVQQILSLSGAASPEWDAEVQRLLLIEYDTDRTGALDSKREIKGISCDTWNALNHGVLSSEYASPFHVIYGFAPDTLWVGYALGFDASMRKPVYKRIKKCGLVW